MSEQKPCGCDVGPWRPTHAPNCPNTKPEREPGCLPECMPGGYLHAIKCPKAMWNKAPEPVCPWDRTGEDCACDDKAKCAYSVPHSKPAPEPQAEEPIDLEAADLWASGTAHGHPANLHVKGARAYLALKAENAALKAEVERIEGHVFHIGRDLNHAESELRLMTEKLAESEQLRQATIDGNAVQSKIILELRAKLAEVEKERAEIAKATRRVNFAAFDLYSDILPAVKALEKLLARRKEADRG